MKVAFCGLGRMGAPMAAHVLRAGHELSVWNRTPGRAAGLVAAGASEAASPAEAAAGADVAVTMLFGPEAVRDVVLGPDGIATGMPTGGLVVDCTTIGSTAAQQLGRDLAQRGLRFVDAPVAGSVGPATDGTLGVLAGASEADWTQARPLLELWGDPAKVRRVGEVGAGSAMKLVLNLTLGVVMAGVGEALALGRDLALDPGAVLDVLGTGPVGFTVNQKRTMLETGDFQPANFTLELLAKDLELCRTSAREELALTTTTLKLARSAVAAGRGGDDYSALAEFLSRRTGQAP